MLTTEEYDAISRNLEQDIGYFAQAFHGTSDEALYYIVNCQLAPSALTRSPFCERAISNAIHLGCQQVAAIYACGYDRDRKGRDDKIGTMVARSNHLISISMSVVLKHRSRDNLEDTSTGANRRNTLPSARSGRRQA